MMNDNNEFSELIPKYLNNQLESGKREAFEKRLETDPSLKQELEEYSFIKKSYSNIEETMPSVSDDLFSKIMNKIESQEKESLAPKEEFKFDLGLNRLFEFIKDTIFTPQVGWSLAIAQLAVILFLVFSTPAPHDKIFQTLSNTSTDPASGNQVNVVFKEDAVQKNVQELLHDVDATIINGPSENGMYILLIDPAINDDNQEEKKKEAVIILKESDIVKFAQEKM